MTDFVVFVKVVDEHDMLIRISQRVASSVETLCSTYR